MPLEPSGGIQDPAGNHRDSPQCVDVPGFIPETRPLAFATLDLLPMIVNPGEIFFQRIGAASQGFHHFRHAFSFTRLFKRLTYGLRKIVGNSNGCLASNYGFA